MTPIPDDEPRLAPPSNRTLLVGLALAVAALALAAPAQAQPDAGAPPTFQDAADDRGLDFRCQSWDKQIGLMPRWFTDAFFCPSPVVADLNGDGYQDLFFPNQRYPLGALNEERDPQDRLYINQGDGTFRDVTEAAGYHDTGYSMGAAAVDHDGDGDLDLYVANFPSENPHFQSPSTTLYVNRGDGTFDATHPEGLETWSVSAPDGGAAPDHMFGSAAAAADYDRDGDLDVARGNYAEFFVSQAMPDALQNTIPETNLLYENQGDGTFEDVTLETGFNQRAGRTFAVNFVDLNQDGWPDLYVANDENPNELYLNRPDPDAQDPHERVLELVDGAADPRGAMCSEVADWNNDGDLDLYMTHYEDELNGYWLGAGNGSFTNADTLGDLETTYHMLGWGCPAFDAENDGDLDLFVANGHMTPTGGEFFHDDPADDNGYALPNQLYLNALAQTGNHTFEEVTDEAGPAFEPRRSTSGAVAADLDRDGRQEVVAVNNNGEDPLYLDAPGTTGNRWLSLDLRQPGDNEYAVGARVTVAAGDLTRTAVRTTGSSMASGSVAPVHVGLGDAPGPAEVTVAWPAAGADAPTRNRTYTVPLDQHVRIVEGQGLVDDTRAPRPNVTVDGAAGDGDWYTGDSVTVSLEAADPGPEATGLASLSYRLDDGPLRPYDGPIVVDDEGRHVLRVVAEDQAGNRAWFPYTFGLDAADPTVEITEPEDGKVHVQGLALDAPAGGDTVLGPAATEEHPLGHGDDVVDGYAHEAARRTGQAVPYPTSLEAALEGTAGSDGETRVRAQADDAVAGIDRVVFHVDGDRRAVDGEAPYTWDADLRDLPAGEHTIAAVAHDASGRTAEDTRTVETVPASPGGAAATAQDPDAGAPDVRLPPPEPGLQAALPGPDDLTRQADPGDDRHFYNGAGSYLPANDRDAPIWRQLNFISDDQGGTVGQYVVLNPDTFLTSPEPSKIYQFPECQSLDPVLDPPLRKPRPPGGEPVPWDRPQRQIVNVKLSTGCGQQPTSVEEVHQLSTAEVETGKWVNAPKLPERIDDWPQERIFNAPPYRPLLDAYQGGEPVKFITYEASWMPPWNATNFPGVNDVFIVSSTPTFRPGFTLFNVNLGAPNHPSHRGYSPVWRGNCIVDLGNEKCMISVNKRSGYEQPRTVAEAITLDKDGDRLPDVTVVEPNTFTHINCPYVAVDTNGNDFVDPHEELYFPNLWVDGPVAVT